MTIPGWHGYWNCNLQSRISDKYALKHDYNVFRQISTSFTTENCIHPHLPWMARGCDRGYPVEHDSGASKRVTPICLYR